VFRQIVEDVSARYQNDEGIRTALELAQSLGSLDLKQMDGHLRHIVTQAIRTIAEETASGTIKVGDLMTKESTQCIARHYPS
jgi:hypothetical protein